MNRDYRAIALFATVHPTVRTNPLKGMDNMRGERVNSGEHSIGKVWGNRFYRVYRNLVFALFALFTPTFRTNDINRLEGERYCSPRANGRTLPLISFVEVHHG